MRTKNALWVSLFLLTHNLPAAAVVTAPLYRAGSQPPQLLFRLEAQRGADAWEDRYLLPDGTPAVIERLRFQDGEPLRYEFDDRQEGGLGVAERQGDALVLSWTQDGKTVEKREKAPAHLLCGPSYVNLLRADWDRLLAGERVIGTVPVLSRKRLMTADLSFQRRPQDDADGRLRVVMKPANWFVALFFPPISLDFDPATRRLLRVQGRSLLKEKVDGKWEMTDVDLTYSDGGL